MTLPRFRSPATRLFIKKLDSQSPVFSERVWSYITLFLATFCLTIIFIFGTSQGQKLISPLISPLHPLTEKQVKAGHEVFGFAPWWKINDLDSVDFNVLTTFSYFGVPVNGDGTLDREDQGYSIFQSKKATEIFKKAHAQGTRVVLTLTQMDNDVLDTFLQNPEAQKTTIREAVAEVRNRGIDGINVDFEYVGDPGAEARNAFSNFVKSLTEEMHKAVPASKVTVSVYASAATAPKMTDIKALAAHSDGIFMMAYDFAVLGSDVAMPTAPLYGKKEGKYWYDISTAVNDFLKLAPANKLILGVPYYGYNYPVQNVSVKAPRHPGYYTYYWYRYRQYRQYHSYSATVQTYSALKDDVVKANSNIKTGWDEYGRVGYIAYQEGGVWRMVFMEDARSLSEKYEFAKSKQLAGTGIWALGFDDGKDELWAVLRDKFGKKPIADARIVSRTINEVVSE